MALTGFSGAVHHDSRSAVMQTEAQGQLQAAEVRQKGLKKQLAEAAQSPGFKGEGSWRPCSGPSERAAQGRRVLKKASTFSEISRCTSAAKHCSPQPWHFAGKMFSLGIGAVEIDECSLGYGLLVVMGVIKTIWCSSHPF